MKRAGILILIALLIAAVMPVPSLAARSFVKNYQQHQLPEEISTGELILYQPENAEAVESDTRTPLILVHGIDGEEGRYFYWERFLAHSQKNPDFHKRFRIYLFRYESSQSLPELSGQFRRTLSRFIREQHQPRLRILAYSEGGLLARDALADPELNPHIEKVIAIATPFHGTPLANPQWMRQSFRKSGPVSPVRLSNRLFYGIARKKFPSFERDFDWDNFDQALPENREVSDNAGATVLTAENLPPETYTHKLVTYGSYFGVGLDPDQHLPRTLGVPEPLPKETHRLRNPLSIHFFFAMVRNPISKMPLAYGKQMDPPLPPSLPVPDAEGDPSRHVLEGIVQVKVKVQTGTERLPLMAYNDGISPISSTLWLGRYTPTFSQEENPGNRLWLALKKLKESRNARLFSGLDHRDWMDGRTRMRTREVRDLLHPEESPKTAFDWFMFDLMT